MNNIKHRFFGFKIHKFAWLETFVVALLSTMIWLLAVHKFQIVNGQPKFLWACIGPLIIGLRYGTAKGFVCALATVTAVFVITKFMATDTIMSLSNTVGICVAAILAGEFHDVWYKKIEKYKLNHDYMERKLHSFTQNYHLLKVSHDQLEQKIATDTVNLRSSMLTLQRIASKSPSHELTNLSSPFLDIFRETGGIEVAGIYKVENNHIVPNAIKTLGDQHKFDANDPMLLDMMKHKMLATIAKSVAPHEHQSRYQVCIPLVDTNDELQAVILVEKVKFFMLTNINIALMSALANFAADLVSSESTTPRLEPSQGDLFRQYLNRAMENREQFGADSSVVICIDRSGEHEVSLSHAVDYRRGADVYWTCRHSTNNTEAYPAVAVLLPLTSLVDAQAYILRLKEILSSQLGVENKSIDILGPFSLDKNFNSIDAFLQELGE